ncbi:MAG: 16S rRNA (cytosine(967)-C(5))-methyltransferase RsmB, partial [Candidatus Cloacimonetes bacterium]|nr:16S rRNA (cytosine(967)-C(5))-methyltransferase RsmB [Candidatus Cloacimonadota bacterium]
MNIRKEAYNIITTVLSKQLFSDKLLDKMAKRLRSAGENADLLYFLVKGVIKMEKNLEYIAAQFTDKERFSKTDKKIKYLIYLGLFQLIYSDKIPDHAAVNETVMLAKKNFNNKIGNFV